MAWILRLSLKAKVVGEAGSSPPLNPDYDKALPTLLRRLSRASTAVLVDALVDSTLARIATFRPPG